MDPQSALSHLHHFDSAFFWLFVQSIIHPSFHSDAEDSGHKPEHKSKSKKKKKKSHTSK
jgi:hypothetical protein